MMLHSTDIHTGVYFHIPFCKKACHYCNFHFSTSIQSKAELTEAIVKEIEMTKGKDSRLISTVYFGGGTPSLLLKKELKLIMDKTKSSFQFIQNTEISFEVNPDDVTPSMLQFWTDQGINRLSIGVQSFRDEDLKWMNRAHQSSQAIDAIQMAKAAGYNNYSIDLIYGIPGLTDEAWLANIDQALAFDIPHLSAYALTVEPKTALKTMIEKEKSPDVDQDQQARQFLLLSDKMIASGYEHYEISNFAKPGMRSKHNTAYWQNVPYFGFGPGAHSFDGLDRYWNISNNSRYIEAIEIGNIAFEKETLTPIQLLNEYIMTSIRTMEGIQLSKINQKWGVDASLSIEQKSIPWITRGYLTKLADGYCLTREGKLFADGISADLFME
jgi:oxygen-independent coproporphyrinogen-3 oxidase